MRICERLRFAGKILSATISRTAGRWFVSIAVEMPDVEPPPHAGPSVGIDFGCTDFASLSTGEKVTGPKPHKVLLARLRRLNQSLHRKVIGSSNRFKARKRLAKLHARIGNIRKDFLHKFTADICRRFSVIGIEDLNVSGMSKNHALARSITDQSFYETRRQLTYKAPTHGCKLAVADRFFPSSKLCSACGVKVESLPIKVRKWTCSNCGVIHDRDINAGINLRNNAVSSTVSVCGVFGSGVGPCDVKLGTVKQESGTREADAVIGVGSGERTHSTPDAPAKW